MPPQTHGTRVGPRTMELASLVTLICLSAAGIAFFVVVSIVRHQTHLDTEEHFLLAFRQADDLAQLKGPAWLESAVRDVTALGSSIVLTLLTLATITFLLLNSRFRAAVLMAASAAGGQILSSFLKHVIDRPRPSVVPHLTSISDPSFPSGHSMLASVVYLTLGALLAETSDRRRNHLFFLGAAVLLTLAVGLSRMALGVHYPTDVIGGWLAGSTWALCCWILLRVWRRERPIPHINE